MNINEYVKKQNRRPFKKKQKAHFIDFKLFSCNSAGLKNKFISLSKIINDANLSIFCLQETHFIREGQIKFHNNQNFQIFEKLRCSKYGGGLAIGARNELNPVWLGDGGQEVESLSVQISLHEMKIRVVNAYGPQEYDNIQKKTLFWEHLDREFFEADKNGEAFILAMDGNLWLGPNILKNDPHKQNKNGELFQNYMQRNPQLTLLNAQSICQGLIT